MLGSDGYREGPMSIQPGLQGAPPHARGLPAHGRARDPPPGVPDHLDDGRVVRDATHEPPRGGAGEYRRDEPLGTCVRIWTQA